MDLVQVNTADGLRLDGALRPANAADPNAAIDVWLCLHGTGSNFYSSKLLNALEPRLARSAAVLRANTRGHDLVTAGGTPGRRFLGAAFERVDESRLDLSAWIELLVAQGFQKIGLLGHSLGAVKALYWLAEAGHPAVRAVVAASPPRLSHSHYLSSSRHEEFRATYLMAEAHVQAGRPDELLLVRFPLVYYVSAAAYLDRYGVGERYNVLRLVERLKVPLLISYGSRELQSDVAFAGMPEEIDKLPAGPAPRQTAVLAGGDHSYATVEMALADRIELWLARQAKT